MLLERRLTYLLINRNLKSLFCNASSIGVLLSGLISKSFGLINQIATTYILAGALGAHGLQSQMLAISFVSWFSLMLLGTQASLPTVLLSKADDDRVAGLYTKSAFLISIFCALAALVLALSILALIHSEYLAETPVLAAVFCNSLLLSVSLSEQMFQALHRIVTFNLLNVTGSILSLLATYALSRTNGGPRNMSSHFTSVC